MIHGKTSWKFACWAEGYQVFEVVGVVRTIVFNPQTFSVHDADPRKAGCTPTGNQGSCEGLVRLLPLLERSQVEVPYPSRHPNVAVQVPLREVPTWNAWQFST